MTSPIKIAIIGYGGIARRHNSAYAKLAYEGAPVKLVAVCDKYADSFRKVTNINIGSDTAPLPDDVHLYTDIDKLIAEEDFDAADVCLPSHLHADVSIRLLKAGKHVLCEKPMALDSASSSAMLDAMEKSGKCLLVGHCLRYDPAYIYLKECIADERFGKLTGLSMCRHSIYPNWGTDRWHDDKQKCGGCIIDTHIHDIDAACFLLGEPDSLSAVAFEKMPLYQWVNTRMTFEDVTVVADGSWDISFTEVFRADYRARFERAAVSFDFKTVNVFTDDGQVYSPDIPDEDRIVGEIRAFIGYVSGGDFASCREAAVSAHRSLALCEAIERSAAGGGETVILPLNNTLERN